MSRIGMLRLLSLGIVLAVLFAVGMLISWHEDETRLAAIARTVAPEHLTDGQKAERLNAWVYANQGFAKNPARFIWSKLDATPIDVLERGGDCEDKSKLLIAMLETVGIDGSMAMQYPCRGCAPVHTVVLADVGDRWAAYDPVYNLSFPDPRGGYYDVRSLRARPEIMHDRLDQLIARRGSGDKIAKYGRRDHVYTHITTVNWDKNDATQAVASVLPLFGLEPALTPRPFFLDNPKQFFAVAGFSVALLFAVLAFFALPSARRTTVGAKRDRASGAFAPGVGR
jgi:Transglutaminase-like superfamily